ncbi:hypothetical protein [Allohahella marinimesophila]|uniref:Uncharacterized protein n=1 Tax=Allohahella marinimesophila TaxID=1054972 RepID=A0ABP7NF12_9GAMM
MSPYAQDEAHRQRCLAALGIDGSALRADLYAVRSRAPQAQPADVSGKIAPVSIAAVRQIVVADESAPKATRPGARQKQSEVEAPSEAASVPQPALDSFSMTACQNGLHWFGVFSGEQKSSEYKAQRTLFQSICRQFGDQPASGDASPANFEPGLVTVFQWPPLKPSVLALLGGVDQLAMYRRCIAERLPELMAMPELTASTRRPTALLFGADLDTPESGSAAGVLEDEHCLFWREILTMPEETLRKPEKLAEQVGPRIVLLPPLSRLLADFDLRRSVQTVLLLLSPRRLSAKRT